MSKHTPEPWEWVEATNTGGEIETRRLDGANKTVTIIGGEIDWCSRPILVVTKADADLITTAPRLLAACKEAERLLTHIDRLGECPDTLKQMYTVRSIKEEAGVAQILRDAIALAEPGENKSEIPVDSPSD